MRLIFPSVLLIAAAVWIAGCAAQGAAVQTSRTAQTARLLANDLLAHEKIKFVGPEEARRPHFDFHRKKTHIYWAMHYAEACAGFGALGVAEALGDKALEQAIIDHYRIIHDEGPENTGNHVDANVYGILPLEIYRVTGDEAYLREGMRLANMQWENPRPDGLTPQARFWIDDMWMAGALQVQAYRATGERKYIDRAALLLKLYCEKLQQSNGLFHHGTNAPHFWGRGNGWVAASLAFCLSELPKDHPDFDELAGDYRRMMAALLKYQAPSGLWLQLIDNPDAWDETSCTAMFGYAMAVGVRTGLLEDPAYRDAIEKAWAGLMKHIDKQGKVHEICVGTSKKDSVSFYLKRKRKTGDLHGQAPAMWFATEMIRMGE